MRRALALLLGLAACPEGAERPQWTVVISTDAPLPQLGDRLLVEVLRDDGALACDGCRRVFSAGDPAVWPISFGAGTPESGAALRVRARLHRADHVGFDGAPSGAAHLDALGRLPATDAPLRVELRLSLRCFGVLADVTAGQSCDPATGLLAEAALLGPVDDAAVPLPGSAALAQPSPCPAEVPAEMACIPGGLYLIGSPFTVPPTDQSDATVPERLVQLSPFALDRDELTVGAVRALALSGVLPEEPQLRDPDSKALDGACTWLGAENAANDALPVNCLDHDLAGAICSLLGKRLPTEAEWEYAAGSGSAETPHPWGYDDDVCGHAIVARGRVLEAYVSEPASCRTEGGVVLPWGPVAGGSETDLSQAGVRNLGGNVAEWVADQLAWYGSACWSGGAPALADPLCLDGTTAGSEWSVRGGSWNNFAFSAKAAERNGSLFSDPGAGVRCARSF